MDGYCQVKADLFSITFSQSQQGGLHITPPNTLLLCRNSATYWITSQLQMRTGKKRRFMLVESLVCRIQLHING